MCACARAPLWLLFLFFPAGSLNLLSARAQYQPGPAKSTFRPSCASRYPQHLPSLVTSQHSSTPGPRQNAGGKTAAILFCLLRVNHKLVKVCVNITGWQRTATTSLVMITTLFSNKHGVLLVEVTSEPAVVNVSYQGTCAFYDYLTATF